MRKTIARRVYSNMPILITLLTLILLFRQLQKIQLTKSVFSVHDAESIDDNTTAKDAEELAQRLGEIALEIRRICLRDTEDLPQTLGSIIIFFTMYYHQENDDTCLG